MRWTGRLLVLAAVVMLGGGWPGIPAQVESLSRVPVDEMDPALPANWMPSPESPANRTTAEPSSCR